MERTYLGAFGNGCFIKAQYELVNGKLIPLDSYERHEIFPNGGTVYFTEKDGNEIKDKFIKFRIDSVDDISPTFNKDNNNSNKYQAGIHHILPLDEDEIIEVLPLPDDVTIDDFLKDKIKQRFRVSHKPNRKILLLSGEFCYGPFEFTLETAYKDYFIKVIIETELINKYSCKDIEGLVHSGVFSMKTQDGLEFIYHIKELEGLPCEQIEYIDEEKLIELLKKVLDNSDSLDTVVSISEDFSRVINSFGNPKELDVDEEKLKRLSQLLENSEELKGYKNKLIENYFKINGSSAAKDKENYLKNHEEIIEELAKRDSRYEELFEQYQNKLVKLSKQIKKGSAELENQQALFEEYKEKVLKEQRNVLDEMKRSQKQELESLEKRKNDAEKEMELFENNKERLKETIDTMKKEKYEIEHNIKQKISDWAAENRNSEMVNLLFSELAYYKKPGEDRKLCELPVMETKSAEDIVMLVQGKLVESGRKYTKDDVLNYIISVVQNYITVLAGEPGTGKTSLCRLLSKAFGLYDDRYAEIMVERGWTSAKDLVGYYNPLTKEIEKTQPAFSDCMETLSEERRLNREKLPYFVLLDEANLSPIEFYWSNFNYFCDHPGHQRIQYANGEEYCFGEELKFFATINYDHTTEVLSPRFLDRAWVILMQDINIEDIISFSQSDREVDNNKEVIAYSNLLQYFGKDTVCDKKLNRVTKERLTSIIGKMNSGGHSISARSVKAICNYYLVAENYMSSKEAALDYAIAQKLLPLLSGNGQLYEEFLKELLLICSDSQLVRCTHIIQRVLDKGEHGFYGFFNA